MLCQGGNEKDVFILQRNICHSAFQDAFNINGKYGLCAIGFHAAQDGTGGHSLLGESVGLLQQGADGGHLATQLIHAGTEYGSFNLHHILITVEYLLYLYTIAILQSEASPIKLIDIEDTLHLSVLALDTQRLFVGITSKTATVLQKGGQALVLTHLIGHGAFDLSTDFHNSIIGPHLRCQPDDR